MPANAADRLIQHYVDNFRRLPWRAPPGGAAPDPYRVWLSEVMLQQTTVAAVTPRFQRFLERWPTIDALAAAPDNAVLSEWAGLGYYARARNLIACAREVAERGGFPRSATELRQLPGVGDYTSSAIAAIAFGEAAAAVDTNVTRVIARLNGLKEPKRPQIAELMMRLMDGHPPGDFVQALMDLGATICTPRQPRCEACPIRQHCAAFKTGNPDAFPERAIKAKRPHKHGLAYWIEQEGRVWLVRRPPKGLLGGMAALPGSDWSAELSPPVNSLGTVRHVFTHFSLDLHLVAKPDPSGEGWWQPIDELAAVGLPTLYRRAAELAQVASKPPPLPAAAAA